MKLCKYLCVSAYLLFSTSLVQATSLSAGDIQFVAYQADNPDSFAFVSWTSLDATTQINFTDKGWLTAGGFRSGESQLSWLAGQVVTAGSLVVIDSTNGTSSIGSVSGSVSLSSSGDQLFAVDALSSAIITGIQMNGSWDADASSAGTSALPPAISTELLNFFIAPEADNAVYNGVFTGLDVNAYRQAIDNPANWVSGNALADVSFAGLQDFQLATTTAQPTVTAQAAVPAPAPLLLLLPGLLLFVRRIVSPASTANNQRLCYGLR